MTKGHPVRRDRDCDCGMSIVSAQSRMSSVHAARLGIGVVGDSRDVLWELNLLQVADHCPACSLLLLLLDSYSYSYSCYSQYIVILLGQITTAAGHD